MSEKSVNKQFGARTLTDEEVKLTLPTYEKLLAQIEEFRRASWNEEQSSQLQNQKINNISILGARGTGKTSILKTLISHLEEKGASEEMCPQKGKVTLGKNIMLPLIVPETMSESASMMSMILGLFKQVVDKIEKAENRESGTNCWEKKECEVVKRYKELVKKFCLIQPDFKQISIKEYTTENDYVRKSSEIYQADCEFLSFFHAFIHSLLKHDKDSMQEKLIFIFIDDIDLCTHRSVEIVRTLLAYLSHPRIVAVISGDLETFEEALVLDFIRRDGILNSQSFKETFVLSKSGMEYEFLSRKKGLAYEYLKKIFPVTHRHQVLKWSLENRGTYAVGGSNHTLVDLLQSSFCYTENPPVFQYYDTFEDPKSTAKNIPLMFHLFDDTARGLNAVFNVMLDVYQVQANKEFGYESEEFFSCIKQLLETIVSSNAVLNRFREVLFNNIVKFGLTLDSTEVILSNFESLFSEYLYSEKDGKHLKDEGITIGFTLFLFLDFAIRILNKSSYLESDNYLKLKSSVIQYAIYFIFLGVQPSIQNTSYVSSKNYDEVYEQFLLSLSRMATDANDTELDNGDHTEFRESIIELMKACSFHQSLTLFQLLANNGYRVNGNSPNVNPAVFGVCFYNMIRSTSEILSEMCKEKKTSLDDVMTKVVGDSTISAPFFLQHLVSGSTNINTIRIILDEILEELINDGSISSKYVKRRDLFKRLVTNSIGKEVENSLFEEYRVIPIKEKAVEYELTLSQSSSKKNTEDRRRLELLLSIDNRELWRDSYANMSAEYMAFRIKDTFKKFDFDKMFDSIDISSFEESRKEFKRKFGEKSNDAMAKRLIGYIDRNVGDKHKIKLSVFRNVYERIEDHANNQKVWYGRAEAFDMLSYLDDAFVDFVVTSKVDEPNIVEIENKEQELNKGKSGKKNSKKTTDLKKELEMYLHFYARYKIGTDDSIYETSRTLAKLRYDIYQGLKKGSNQMTQAFKDKLSSDVDLAIIEEFEELFPTKERSDAQR